MSNSLSSATESDIAADPSVQIRSRGSTRRPWHRVALGLAGLLAVAGLGVAPSASADEEPPPPPSTDTVLTTSPNPSASGQTVTLTARVTSADGTTPTGQILFSRQTGCGPFPGGDEDVCTTGIARSVPLVNGVATLQKSDLPVGTTELKAYYFPGLANYDFSESPFLTQTVTAATVVRVAGSGTLPLGTESAQFTLDLTANNGSGQGSCQLTGQTTSVRCTSFYEVKRTGSTVTFRGTGLYNNRQPISFTATVVDGTPDSFRIYGAGQVYGGTLTSGNITVS